MAFLPDRLLMIPREIPSYLKVAYSLRYAQETNEGNCLTRIWRVVQRTLSLIKELLYYRPEYGHFEQNREKLERDFTVINAKVVENQKPICVYFVSAHDQNGAILGNHLYFYHHYKIQNLQKHFAVAPKVVSSQEEMKAFMQSTKQQNPTRQIQFVDVVAHGSKSCLCIQRPDEEEGIAPEHLQEDLFSECAPDATILLDACSTGMGDKNIADEIARKTPGRTVLAPGPSLYFSKPIIENKGQGPRVRSAVHGFAIFNAYTCKSFSYPQKMPSQYPYVKDTSLADDLFSIANFPLLQNAWLDRYIDENSETDKQQVIRIFEQLSAETKALITKKVEENNRPLNELAHGSGEGFLREHPLHTTVRSAFRTVLNELIYEVREYPGVSWVKVAFTVQNAFQAIAAWARSLSGCSAPPAAVLPH